MSYSIYIGNALIQDPGEDGAQWEFDVARVELPDAPSWPNPEPTNSPDSWPDISGRTNGRHPGYGQMADFCRRTGLHDLFFSDYHGLLRPHPGCAVLRPSHLKAVTEARERWQVAHPGAVPGWRDGEDGDLAKLIWYEWWMTWALANCERPAVANH